MRTCIFLLLCLLSAALPGQQVLLTGILDGDLVNANGQGGNPKVIELYVNGSLDLSGYQLSRVNANNVFTFPADSRYENAFVYVVNPAGEALYRQAFSGSDFDNVFLSDQIVGNGNDPYQLRAPQGDVIDQTGGPEGTDNNYQDGHRYRIDNTGPDGGWVEENWRGGNKTVDNQPITDYANLTTFGSYQARPPGLFASLVALRDAVEGGESGQVVCRISAPAATDIVLGYTLTGTAIPGIDYQDPNTGSLVIPADQNSVLLDFPAIDDADTEPVETIVITLNSISDTTYRIDASASINLRDNEAPGITPIHTIQGDGMSSPLVGQTVTISGIVVGDFQGESGLGLGGFFVQEEGADVDARVETSEGIWIFEGNDSRPVNVGDLVEISGEVAEANGLTQLDITGNAASLTVRATDQPLPPAAVLHLPAAATEYEAFEGMRTTLASEVVVTSNFGLGRFGEFEVATGGRLQQFTECNLPDPTALAAWESAQAERRLVVDDGRSGNNNFPIVLGNGQEVNATSSLRAGTRLDELTGIVDERFTGYRLQATAFTPVNGELRPTNAPEVGGHLKIVSANVLNYFTTLGRRGADDADELARQEAKIVRALIALDADILGLAEIENNTAASNGALPTLIAAIAAAGGPTYTAVTNPNSGSDEIMVALIYKAEVVAEIGTPANLTAPAGIFTRNRVPLAQTFRIIAPDHPDRGQALTVCMNHWKSKGGSCGPGDDDEGGAGSCDGTRTAAALAITEWLAAFPTGVPQADQIIMGDLNAYSAEAPLRVLAAAGFVNTVAATTAADGLPCGSRPSFVFRSAWGSLDHIFASASLHEHVTAAQPWAVNAAEPPVLDYDTRFNNPALYADDFYRFSDHDPIVLGLAFQPDPSTVLADFTGRLTEKDVTLNWQIRTDSKVVDFVLERANATTDFTAIATVTPPNAQLRDFSFTDTLAPQGENRYRLRIRLEDGDVFFSSPVVVTVEGTNSVRVATRPDRTFQLSGAQRGSSFVLTDAKGSVLRRGVVRADTENIRGDDLPAGVYFLVVQYRGARESFRMVLP